MTVLRTCEMKADIPSCSAAARSVSLHTYGWFIERLSSHIRAELHNSVTVSFSKLEGSITLKILTSFSGDHYMF